MAILFDRPLKNLKRTREIARILVKYGFENVVVNTPLQNFVSERARSTWAHGDKSVFEFTSWERVRMVVEELGPTFIKGAQVLGNRPDLLPEQLLTEFQKLQSNVAPFSFEKAREIVEIELGKTLEELFDWFDEKPIGSASIGQVHRATLKGGQAAVVKIQRPDVKNMVETDLSIVKEIVRFGAKFFEQNGIMNPLDIVIAFEKSMQKELDYRTEARNIVQFREFYKDETIFYVPKVYKEYTTARVMALEFVEGCKITNVDCLTEWGIDPRKIAQTGMHIYLRQIFEFGFFHADPHPGNVLVRPDGVICLIDFGMVGRLSRREKLAFAGLFIAMAQQDARAMASNFRKLAFDDDITDIKLFEADLQEIIDDFAVLDVSESNMAALATRMQSLIYQYRLKVPGAVFIIFRALAILEGMGKILYPELNTMEEVKPYGQKLLLELYSPQNLGSDAFNTVGDLLGFLNTFPAELKDIVRKLRQGRLHTQIGIEGYEHFLLLLDRIMSRISLTLLIVALLLFSGIVMNAPLSPSLRTEGGIPYLSVVGLVLATILALLLWRKSSRKTGH